MDKIPDKVKAIIEKFLNVLKENNFPVSEVYLFGSFARGNYNEWSDIDLAIVSEVFEGSRIPDRDKIRKYYLSVSSDLEIIPFSKEDFTPDNPFVKEIMETGIRLN